MDLKVISLVQRTGGVAEGWQKVAWRLPPHRKLDLNF